MKRNKRKKNKFNKKQESNPTFYKEQTSFFSLLNQGSGGKFSIIFILGWIYILIWMNTEYYNHSIELIYQPNLIFAGLPPLLVISCFLLYITKKEEELMGGNILTHVIWVLIISFCTVLGILLSFIIVLILLGVIALILGFGG